MSNRWRKIAAFAVSLAMCAGTVTPIYADEIASDVAASDTAADAAVDTEAVDTAEDAAEETVSDEEAPSEDVSADVTDEDASSEDVSSSDDDTSTEDGSSSEEEPSSEEETAEKVPADGTEPENGASSEETSAEETEDDTAPEDGASSEETSAEETEDDTASEDELLTDETTLAAAQAGQQFSVKDENNKVIATYQVLENGSDVALTKWSQDTPTINVPSTAVEDLGEAGTISHKVVKIGINSSAFSSTLKNVMTINLPNSVTTISNNAFQGAATLQTISIPNTVSSIGQSAFYGCKSLGQVTIPDGVTNIGQSTFNGCAALTQVTVPDSVQTIGNYAFNGCTSLQTIKIPNGVEAIPTNTFSGCSSLNNVSIPSSVKTIGSFAFQGCTSLTVLDTPWNAGSVTCTDPDMICYSFAFPKDSVSITLSSFDRFVMYQSVGNSIVDLKIAGQGISGMTFPSHVYRSSGTTDTITTIGVGDKSLISSYKDLQSIVIPDTVTKINARALMFSKGAPTALTSIEVPNTVKTIGASAFAYCSSLKTINIPDTLTVIESSTFFGCEDLDNITIPHSVLKVDASAFAECTSLEHLKTPWDTEAVQGTNAFIVDKNAVDISPSAFNETKKLQYIIYEGTINQDNGLATITGCKLIGNKVEELIIPSSLNGHDVVGIAESAFETKDQNQKKLPASVKTIVLPYTIKNLGSRSFANNYYLQQVYWKDTSGGMIDKTTVNAIISAEAFMDCKGLISAPLDTCVATIDEYAFAGCHHLANCAQYGLPNNEDPFAEFGTTDGLDIPVSVTTIRTAAFMDCWRLKKVHLSDNISTLGDSVFEQCTTLEEVRFDQMQKLDLGRLPNKMFKCCCSLREVVIPDKVQIIGQKCFADCSKLATVTFGTDLKEIESAAFDSCVSLEAADFKDQLEIISDGAFRWCLSLEHVQLPTKLRSIGREAFCNCEVLPQISFPNSLSMIGDFAFSNCSALGNVTIPNACSIGSGAFRGCTSFTAFTFPEGTQTINYAVLAQCTKLESVTIPDSVTKIIGGGAKMEDAKTYMFQSYYYTYRPTQMSDLSENDDLDKLFKPLDTKVEPYLCLGCQGAFADCISLKSIHLPNGITEIGKGTFWKCYNLKELNYPTELQTIGEYAFLYCKSLP
ncbi:MAG: leucine-rich repeat domain-containing protein, partial [Oscillospiraceae bacterium]|nr:leucine-rich repeat domain-containing protein [Oscillospiraceae bacterium]